MSKRLKAMVLVYMPELTQSVWQDFFSQHRKMETLERRLRLGVKQGEWVAWRLIRVEKEVVGNDEILLALTHRPEFGRSVLPPSNSHGMLGGITPDTAELSSGRCVPFASARGVRCSRLPTRAA